MAYLLAVQGRDQAAIERIWREAETDAELTAVLKQLDEELKREGWL